MSIPWFNEHGLLPEGIHDCTLEEAESRFGGFQESDRRPQLWAKFREFVQAAKVCGIVVETIVNGSFVTAIPRPNDIDLVLVLSSTHDFRADLSPSEYNIVSKRRVRERFGFDILIARVGTEEVAEIVDFFHQVRREPSLRKGVVRIRL